MSNVLARDRGLSSLTFYSHLVKITRNMLAYFNDPKNFEGRTYYSHCAPMIRGISEAMQDLIIANSIVPLTPHDVMIRRDYQNMAIGRLEGILENINIMVLELNLSIAKKTKMREIIDSIKKEIDYIKWWRKQNNSLMKKFREADKLEEIQTNPYGLEAAVAKLGDTPVPFIPQKLQPMIFVPPEFTINNFYGEPGRVYNKPGISCPIYSLADYPPAYQHEYKIVTEEDKRKANNTYIKYKDKKSEKINESNGTNIPGQSNAQKSSSRPITPKRRVKTNNNFFTNLPSSNSRVG